MLLNEHIVHFVDSHKQGTHLQRWTTEQIGTYILGAVKAETLRACADSEGNITGVVIFNPSIRGDFWIEQIWLTCKTEMIKFLKVLKQDFPLVQNVWGRRGNRTVKFNLTTLHKIYGW